MLSNRGSSLRLVNDPRAEFERLYRENYAIVYNWTRARMGNDSEAEDVVADAFLNAAKAFKRFDPSRSKFSTWVITIAKNCMVSRYRKQRTTVAIDDVPEGIFGVEGEQSQVDDKMLARKLLSVLDPEETQIICLKYCEGKRNVEIARELGVNASTISTKISRALQKMRTAAS